MCAKFECINLVECAPILYIGNVDANLQQLLHATTRADKYGFDPRGGKWKWYVYGMLRRRDWNALVPHGQVGTLYTMGQLASVLTHSQLTGQFGVCAVKPGIP